MRAAQALRIAAGLSTELVLCWGTGVFGGVTLAAAGPAGYRWLERCWKPCYPEGLWEPVRGLPVDGNTMLLGAAAESDPSPFPTDFRECRWSDAVQRILASEHAGTTIEWRFRPTGAGTPSRPRSDPGELVPRGWQRTPQVTIELELRDSRVRKEWGGRWNVALRVLGRDNPEGRRQASRIAAVLSTASCRPGGNRLSFFRPTRFRRLFDLGFTISDSELQCILPGLDTPVVEWAPSAHSFGRSPITIGRSYDGRRVPLPEVGHEGRHLLILGETGMGKSSLLTRLLVSATHQGGVVLFDPIGDTARKFLGSLDGSAVERATWISATESPVGLNALDGRRGGPDRTERLVGDLTEALRRVRESRFPERSFWGPRIEEMVGLALTAAASFPNGTLSDACALLQGCGSRRVVTPENSAESVSRLKERVLSRPDEVEGARRLLSEVASRPTLARLLAESHARFSWRDALTQRRIVVISGEAAHLGESAARYLLAVHLALVWCELIVRPRPEKTFVALDEAQWFVHESANQILRLGRRSNVHLWMATQSLHSLPRDVQEAVLTNAADFVLFRGSPEEAREFERSIPALRAEEILRLQRGSAILLTGKGSSVEHIRTGPLTERGDSGAQLERIRSQSRALVVEVAPQVEGNSPGADATARSHTDAAGRSVLLLIWAAVLASPSSGSTIVPLSKLRSAEDPDGRAVRETGRLLRRHGLLESTGRNSLGSYWVVRREGLAALLGPQIDPSELQAACGRWTSAELAGGISSSEEGF